MNKLLASFFAAAALLLATSAFAADAAKVTEPVKAATTKTTDKVVIETEKGILRGRDIDRKKISMSQIPLDNTNKS